MASAVSRVSPVPQDAFAPLQALRDWLVRPLTEQRPAAPLPVQQPVRASWRPRPVPVRRRVASPVTATPLRIHSGEHGRLVISGRMADVCAELERLAAIEARGQRAPCAQPAVVPPTR